MSTLRGPAQLADLQGALCVPTYNLTTLYLPMVVLPLCPSPSQSAVSEYSWGSTSCGVVSTRQVVIIVPAFLEL